MVNVSSILTMSTMIITNKYTGRDVTREYLALLEGLNTKQEFELRTITIKGIKEKELAK